MLVNKNISLPLFSSEFLQNRHSLLFHLTLDLSPFGEGGCSSKLFLIKNIFSILILALFGNEQSRRVE